MLIITHRISESKYLVAMDHSIAPAPPYRHVAWIYDLLASAYSLGAIDRAKRSHHKLIRPGDRVLYIGAGRGKEIAAACKLGAEVTCVEPCPAMAKKLHQRLSNVADRFTIVPKPIQSIPADPAYDLVVAHFFLNIFDTGTMPAVLTHICGFVKHGGSLVIADFKPSGQEAGSIERAIRWLHYRPVNLAGRLLRICSLHPIYDYEPLLKDANLTVSSRESQHILPGLTDFYEVVTAGHR